MPKAHWRISEVAARFHVHPQTLRLYERQGLLRPSRSRGNTRSYDAADLERLEFILTLSRDLGVNLAGIEVILNMRERLRDLQDEVARLAGALQEELSRQGVSAGALVPLGPRPIARLERRR